MKERVEEMHVNDRLYAYIAGLSEATREHPYIELGLSPRGSIACVRMAKAWAYLKGREYVLPEDVVDIFLDVAKHRIVLNTKARVARVSAAGVLQEILAKVKQIGGACHTGAYSCFFNKMLESAQEDLNPLAVFNEVYDVILDRKKNPKEGSYTNYLFDKGIDKILKKCGEEATEIVIAAKNPEKEEIKYEVADFLYHLMVLMVECNVDWNDIVRELAHRR